MGVHILIQGLQKEQVLLLNLVKFGGAPQVRSPCLGQNQAKISFTFGRIEDSAICFGDFLTCKVDFRVEFFHNSIFFNLGYDLSIELIDVELKLRLRTK